MGRPTGRVLGSAVLAIAALFVAVLTRRADAVVLAAPFAFVSLAGLAMARIPSVGATAVLDTRFVEGETADLALDLDVASGRGRVRIGLALPSGVEVIAGSDPVLEMPLFPGTRRVEWKIRFDRWGAFGPLRIGMTVTDRLGTRSEARVVATDPVRVYPTESTIRGALSPNALRTVTGGHLSRQRGDGIEFVDIREFTPGDRARDVNWRITARRGRPWVDQRRPERSGEVVLFVDSFVSVGDRFDSTLRRAAEVATAVARRHIGVNDRVGLVDLGGLLRWLRPGGGTAQLYRLIDVLIETEHFASSAAKTVDVLPARALPRRCLVVALTPLIDPRGIEALRMLRARGFDVAVVEVSPSAFVPEPTDRRQAIARSLWHLERDSTRADLRRRGMAVAEWDGSEPLDVVIDSLGVFRSAVLRAAR